MKDNYVLNTIALNLYLAYMKYHSKFSITNMFTMNLDENRSILPPPLPTSSSRLENRSRVPTPTTSELLPGLTRARTLVTPRLESYSRNENSRMTSIPPKCKSKERFKDEEPPRCLNSETYCPFSSIFKDYAKDRFTSAKPPLPVAVYPATIEARPASPVLRAQRDSNSNLAYQSRHKKFIDEIMNSPPMKSTPSPEPASKSRLPFGLGSFFNKAESKELTRVVSEREEQFCKNIQFDDEGCSSGLFLLGDRGGSVARVGEGGSGEVLRQSQTGMSFDKPYQMVDVKNPPTPNTDSPSPSSAVPSRLESLEALQRLRKAASDSCRRRNSAGQIPNEIQDDMLRIEMLLELRKYKRALSAQINAQQRLIHMCSDQNLPSDQLTSSVLSPHSGQKGIPLPNYIRGLMDQSQEGKSGTNGRVQTTDEKNEGASPRQGGSEKPWEADLAKQILNYSFIEPHPIPSGAEQKPMTQQNQFSPGEREQLRSTMSPRGSSTRQNIQGHGYGEMKSHPGQAKAQSTDNIYQKLLSGKGQLLEGLQNFSPNRGFKIADLSRSNTGNPVSSIAPESTLFLDKLRKPVSVSKPRSTLQLGFHQAESLPYPGMPNPQPFVQHQETGDKPSPFFPGLSGQIDMKIRKPQQSGPHSKHLGEDMDGELEELSKLLSQLPVITRQQKAEEFASRQVILPSSMTDPDSDTSMVPHVSSKSTVTTSERLEGDDRNQTTEDDEDMPLRNMDTNKMSVSELVTLGRKIYKILSQLSTKVESSKTAIGPTSNVKPSPSTTSKSGNTNNNNAIKKQTKSVSNARIQRNPSTSSFTTGPGMVQAKGSSFKPTASLRRVLEPTPTRWAKRSESLHPPALTLSAIRQQRSTMQSSSGTGNYKQPPIAMTNRRSKIGIGEEQSEIVLTSAGKKYSNNNIPGVLTADHVSRSCQRQPTPYTYQAIDEMSNHTVTSSASRGKSRGRNFIQENITKARLMKRLSNTMSLSPRPLPPVPRRYQNIQSVVASRSRSGERDRPSSSGQMTEEKRRATSLPPIKDQKLTQKSPVGYKLPYNMMEKPGGSTLSRPASTSSTRTRPSPVPSRGQLVTSQQQSINQLKVVRQILSKSNSMSKALPQSGPYKVAAVASPAVSKPSPIVIIKSNSDGNASKAGSDGRAMSRKSRSKTKRDSQIAKELRNHLLSAVAPESLKATMSKNNNNYDGRRGGGSDSVIKSQTSDKKIENGLKGKIIVRNSTGKKAQGDVLYFEGETDVETTPKMSQPAFTTSSEQQLIREMVKKEMNMMVEKHVKDVLKKGENLSKPSELIKTHNEEVRMGQKLNQRKDRNMPQPKKKAIVVASEESEFEQIITPIYTPPRLHDESLFFIEKWINPEGSYNTSAKDTPHVSDTEGSAGEGEYTKKGKTPTVRFNLPTKQSRRPGK